MENPKETHSYYALSDWETYEEFNKWLKSIPNEEKSHFALLSVVIVILHIVKLVLNVKERI